MANRNRWILSSLTGLVLAAAAGLAFAAASEEAAGGAAPLEAPTQERHSQIRLVLDRDGSAEQIELADLHELEVGESRTLTTASGTPVVVTRDEQGFELDIDGKQIRLMDHFGAGEGNFTWTGEAGQGQFHKRVVVTDGDEGGANVMILRNKVAVDENGVAVASGGAGEASRDVVMLRRSPGAEGHGFAFTTGDGELSGLPIPLEATIDRLEASAKFQELDAATRAKVLEALRESAPAPGAFVAAGPGARTIVLEMKPDAESDEEN